MTRKPVKSSITAAMCGMAVGLSVVIMLMGGLIPAAVYIVPLLCGLVLLPISIEFGKPVAWATFAATAILAMILDFDKEAAFFYLFIGYYPIVKWSIDKITAKPVRAAVKLALFTVSVITMYGLLNLLFPISYPEGGFDDVVFIRSLYVRIHHAVARDDRAILDLQTALENADAF